MITAVVALVEAAAFVAVIMLQFRHFAAQARAAADERRELVNRVQAPDRIPVVAMPEFVIPEDDEPDELNLVGTITYGEGDSE